MHAVEQEFSCVMQEIFAKALLHDAIFLANYNAIALLRDAKLASTSLYHISLMNSLQIKQSSLIYIS